jgi:WD40 repeat protein
MFRNFFIVILISGYMTSFSAEIKPFSTSTISYTYDIALLSDTLLAVASKEGCHLLTNFTEPEVTQQLIYDKPVYNLITNHKKQILGLSTQDRVLVYDIRTQKKIWQHFVPITEKYSVAISPIDDTCFLCHNGKLMSNKHKTINLALAEPDTFFQIACHPKTNQITYESSNKTLSILSLTSNEPPDRYPRDISGKGTICALQYSPYSAHLALLTKKPEKIYISDRTTRKGHPIKIGNCTGLFHTLTFLPNSFIVALSCEENSIHFWNFIVNKELYCVNIHDPMPAEQYDDIQKCVFSPSGTTFAFLKNNRCVMYHSPPIIKNIITKNKHFYFASWVLKSWLETQASLLPKEICELLMHALLTIYLATDDVAPN